MHQEEDKALSSIQQPDMPLEHLPTEAVHNLFAAEIGGYSVLSLTIGAFAVAGVIGGLRWAYGKALGKA